MDQDMPTTPIGATLAKEIHFAGHPVTGERFIVLVAHDDTSIAVPLDELARASGIFFTQLSGGLKLN